MDLEAVDFVISGAGLTGPLMAILLAQHGYSVQLIERRPDPRVAPVERGRSINLALAARGLHALSVAGLSERVHPLLLPMPGRRLHDSSGQQTFTPYGQRPHEVIYSVSRGLLNELLLDAAESTANIHLRFDCAVQSADLPKAQLTVLEHGRLQTRRFKHLIAADGAGSPVRNALTQATGANCDIDRLTHGYKELTLPPRSNGEHAIDPQALHIWPRGGFMLIALPNLDGSFTVTLFLAHQGSPSFAELSTPTAVRAFFAAHFPDAAALIPELEREFFEHPVGEMATVRSDRWACGDRAVLIGDAAHAILPFHGQGMNCGFEDCVALLRGLESTHGDVAAAFAGFERERIPQANAIADMAIENYVEMRDSVRDPTFQLQRLLALELERRHPDRFIPRYSMVMFHHEIPYATAFQRGAIQQAILRELTCDAPDLEHVDYVRAEHLILERLPDLATATC